MGVHIAVFFSNFGGGNWGLYYKCWQIIKATKTPKMDLVFIL